MGAASCTPKEQLVTIDSYADAQHFLEECNVTTNLDRPVPSPVKRVLNWNGALPIYAWVDLDPGEISLQSDELGQTVIRLVDNAHWELDKIVNWLKSIGE